MNTPGHIAGLIVHELKTHPAPFQSVRLDLKRYEIRKNDRDFQVGHYVRLREFDPAVGQYTGAVVLRRITHITRGGDWGLPADLCVLGIR